VPTEAALHVLDDPVAAFAGAIAEQARAGGSIVLTGGTSVGKAYERAAELAPDWRAVEVWWGDERCVAPDDERSNYGLARRTLLDRLETTPRKLHRIRGELPPAEAAAEYDAALAEASLGLLLLGLGPDGHIASLFPRSPQLEVRDRRVVSGPPGLEPFVERVTLTLPALLSAARIALLVTGEAKADAVRGAFAGGVSADVPGSLLRTGDAPIDVYLDERAAARLDTAARAGL
jgi:6-phosphogluconolactonase